MSESHELDRMTEAERAEYYYARRDDPGFWDEWEEVGDLVPDKPLSTVVSVRLRKTEIEPIERAAHAAGMKISTFIRQAAVAAAHSEDGVDREALATKLASVRRALAEAEGLVRHAS